MIDRFIFHDDYFGDTSWRLLDWCMSRGADEFSVEMLGLQGSTAPLVERAERWLSAFARSPARREFVIGDPIVRDAPLWTLTPESIDVLKHLFHKGLFTYPTSEWNEGCFEGPTFYRSGELMLGVVTHEREGLLRVTEPEFEELERSGFRTFEQSKWL